VPVSRPRGFAPGPAADRPIDVPRVLLLHYGRQNTACADEKAERGMAATVVGGRAIVIGAGIGGLAALARTGAAVRASRSFMRLSNKPTIRRLRQLQSCGTLERWEDPNDRTTLRRRCWDRLLGLR
jgi:hypothetical protein